MKAKRRHSPQHLTPHMVQTPTPRVIQRREASREEPADVVQRRGRVKVRAEQPVGVGRAIVGVKPEGNRGRLI